MSSPLFVIDANIFMEASRRYYAFDIAPGFWSALSQSALLGHIVSIDHVEKEIARGKDELATWCEANFSDYFNSTDDAGVVSRYRDVVNWVQSQDQFFDFAKADFMSSADGWVVAYALHLGATVVTHEVYSKDAKKTVPMPNICKALGVPVIDTFIMMRRLGINL